MEMKCLLQHLSINFIHESTKSETWVLKFNLVFPEILESQYEFRVQN